MKAVEKIIAIRTVRDNKTREEILSDLYDDNIIDSNLFIKLSFNKNDIMKRVIVVFQKSTKLTEGLMHMKDFGIISSKVFGFEVEEDEVELLISEIEELNSPCTIKILGI